MCFRGSSFVWVLATGFLLSGCTKPVTTWNQKMTVEVEIDGETYAGESVTHVRGSVSYNLGFGGRAESSLRVDGEAVIVDMGAHGLLFALIDREPISRPAQW